MKVENYLPKSSQEKISNAVTEAEKKVDAEIVPVFMVSSNNYPEAGLKGAILCAMLSAFIILLYDHLMGWYQLFILENDWLFVLVIILSGLIGYFLFNSINPLKKLLISKERMNKDSAAMAERVFGEYKLYETKSRNGILIFVSLFEHTIHILPDKGLKEKIASDEWQKTINQMKPALRQKKFDEAFIQSISHIQQVLITYKMERNGNTGNELPDHLRENI